jgi:hypothetical protein
MFKSYLNDVIFLYLGLLLPISRMFSKLKTLNKASESIVPCFDILSNPKILTLFKPGISRSSISGSFSEFDLPVFFLMTEI